jgi:hypothetical protein
VITDADSDTDTPDVIREPRNAYRDDPLLADWLRRTVPTDVLAGIERRLDAVGSEPFAPPSKLADVATAGAASTSFACGSGRYACISRLAAHYLNRLEVDASPSEAGPATPSVSQCREAERCVNAIAFMRRSLAAARLRTDGQPMQIDALAALEAEAWGAFLMTFMLVDLIDRGDSLLVDAGQRALLALLAPVTDVAAHEQSAAVRHELVALTGVLEDSWHGPSSRAAPGPPLTADWLRTGRHDGLAALLGRASVGLRFLREPRLKAAGRQAIAALERAALWLESDRDADVVEAGARRLVMTLARGLQLALLCEHAQWLLTHRGDPRGTAAALRFSRRATDLIHETDPGLDRLLLGL